MSSRLLCRHKWTSLLRPADLRASDARPSSPSRSPDAFYLRPSRPYPRLATSEGCTGRHAHGRQVSQRTKTDRRSDVPRALANCRFELYFLVDLSALDGGGPGTAVQVTPGFRGARAS